MHRIVPISAILSYDCFLRYECLFQRQITNINMRIEKNKQRIAAAATAEENLESRPTGRMNPPTDPEAFQAWLNDTRIKVSLLTFYIHLFTS